MAKMPRTTNVAIMVVARPPRIRSTTGPMRGDITRNGPSASTRNSNTRGRAASGDTLKKIEPARDTVKNASAALWTQCVIASRGCRPGPSMMSRIEARQADRRDSLDIGQCLSRNGFRHGHDPMVDHVGEGQPRGLDVGGGVILLDAEQMWRFGVDLAESEHDRVVTRRSLGQLRIDSRRELVDEADVV